jgi:meso-butanediol dehydrogenase/(S,S)-butanediol dehydrogenase/diacetyl reductase
MGSDRDDAATIAFLLSDEASFITGIVMSVDGGQTTGIPAF